MKGSTQMSSRIGMAALASALAVLMLVVSGGGASAASSSHSGGSASGQAKSAKGLVIGDILYDVDAYQIAQQKHMQAYANSLGIKTVFENQKGQGTNAP